jgi:dihydroorotase
MHDVILGGASVLTDQGIQGVDVAITGAVISGVGTDLGVAGETVDCSGLWLGPGLVDMHTHLREPGEEWKEDVESGSRAAAAGGYTAIVAMPNTNPAVDAGHLARFIADRGREVGLVDVSPAGCISLGRRGATMAHLDDLWQAGVRVFTDDGDMVADAALLRSAMDYIAALGGVVSQHAIDPGLSAAGHMHEGSVSSRLGMYGIPRQADNIAIARDLALAKMTGVRYHVQHLSTAEGVALVGQAKEQGLAVTAEVSPHHLTFDHSSVATTDANFKMMPPLREPTDRDALRQGLIDGVIDAIATDHAPHAAIDKEVPFEDAPNGVLGLEWAVAVAVGEAGLDQFELFERMSTSPALIASLQQHGGPIVEGRQANLVVIDPAERWTATSTLSKSRNAPYFGMELTGRVRRTMLRGVTTYQAKT